MKYVLKAYHRFPYHIRNGQKTWCGIRLYDAYPEVDDPPEYESEMVCRNCRKALEAQVSRQGD